MTPLGKSVAFYFKYQPEMLRLYWKSQKHEEVSDPEILRMVEIVGDHCCQKIGEFLTECGKIIETHFAEVAKCSAPSANYKKWVVSCGVWSKQFGKPLKQNWKMQAGVDIPRTKAEIIAWIWGVGKTAAEEKMTQEFGSSVIRSTDVDLPAGRVALARIPILPQGTDGFDVDRDQLLEQVRVAFSMIKQKELDNVYHVVKQLRD